MLSTPGNFAVIDDDTIEVHNLNRLFFASLADARAMLFKVEVAASMMSASGWKVEPIRRTVEHPVAMKLLASAARRGPDLCRRRTNDAALSPKSRICEPNRRR